MFKKRSNFDVLQAKVNGPLMSLSASGGFAGAMVFTTWKGRPVVHQLVTPANPRSTDQTDERNIMRVTGIDQHWANVSTMNAPGQTKPDKERLIDVAPSGFAWNGNFVKALTGVGNVNYDNAVTAWTALTAPQKAAWETAADGLTPPIPAVPQKDPFTNASAAVITAGEAWFIYQWGLYVLGLAAQPGAVPPVYT